ncbi:MAG: primosomal protein N', partial [Bacteroidetes bacterium]
MIFRPAYAEIILPLAVRSNFTYAVRAEQAETIAPGMRVLVSFGKSKIYTGIVRRVMDQAPEGMVADRIKPIEELLDESPVLHPAQLELYDWLSFYYFCTPGEIIKAALPAGLKPESALRVEMCDVPNWHEFSLSDKEFQLMEALMLQPVLTLKDIAGIWDIAGVTPRLRSMASRGLIRIYQQVEEKYKPRFKSYLRLSPEWTDRDRLEQLFEALSRAPKQENLLMRVVSEYYRGKTVPKSETLKELDIQSSVAKSLIDKGILQEEQVRIDRIEMYGYETVNKAISLTERQQQALAQIRGHFASESPKPVLLEGVTGSGKTHLYIELIRDALAKGKQALYLLPEITLTKQIIDRVQGELGEAIGIYHSKFSNDERVEIWQKVSSGEYRVVIGVRSAIFLPFPELGLIVVDEEHDSSFKQHEPAPRYHARDVAVFAGTQQKIPILLGSATPSFESYYNARTQKYHHVLLPERAVAGQMPQIEVVDMRKEKKKGQVNGIFSLTLENAIVETLGRGEQVILFQNRRGYAPYLICESCGHVPE